MPFSVPLTNTPHKPSCLCVSIAIQPTKRDTGLLHSISGKTAGVIRDTGTAYQITASETLQLNQIGAPSHFGYLASADVVDDDMSTDGDSNDEDADTSRLLTDVRSFDKTKPPSEISANAGRGDDDYDDEDSQYSYSSDDDGEDAINGIDLGLRSIARSQMRWLYLSHALSAWYEFPAR